MGLDNLKGRSKTPAISGNCPSCPAEGNLTRIYGSNPAVAPENQEGSV
jgi:hypothetical protein